MSELAAADFGDLIAERISAEHVSISARWLERLHSLLPVDANEIFPSDRLLDHIPALIKEVAVYLRAPDTEAVASNTAIISKAQELGELRHAQRAPVHQLLTEYRVLGGILTTFVLDELQRLGLAPSAAETIEVLRRLNDALWILTQTTVDTFVAEYTATIAGHAARLDSFNRMVSHELRQPLGTLTYALPLMKAELTGTDATRQHDLLAIMDRNVRRLIQLMEQLEVLSRLRTRAPHLDVQITEVSATAWEVARQLREMADARGVTVHVDDALPAIEIDAARLELILMNLVSNAIKYSDPQKPTRGVWVSLASSEHADRICLAVSDNGLGIPEESQAAIFGRFVRVHADRDSELGVRGSGLGLAIVSECVEAVRGTIRVESTVGEGTTFVVCLPRRPS